MIYLNSRSHSLFNGLSKILHSHQLGNWLDMKKILVLNGINLNIFGKRDPK